MWDIPCLSQPGNSKKPLEKSSCRVGRHWRFLNRDWLQFGPLCGSSGGWWGDPALPRSHLSGFYGAGTERLRSCQAIQPLCAPGRAKHWSRGRWILGKTPWMVGTNHHVWQTRGNSGWEPNFNQLLRVMGYCCLTVWHVFILAKGRIRETIPQYYSKNCFCEAGMFPTRAIYAAYLYRCCLFHSGKRSTLNSPQGWKITQPSCASEAPAISKHFLLFKAH